MNAGTFSGVVTGVLLVIFLAGVFWAWSGRRSREFDEAAQLPLDDEERQ
jgi:cytochrome c oxidase cbb3-type subunit IV